MGPSSPSAPLDHRQKTVVRVKNRGAVLWAWIAAWGCSLPHFEDDKHMGSLCKVLILFDGANAFHWWCHKKTRGALDLENARKTRSGKTNRSE